MTAQLKLRLASCVLAALFAALATPALAGGDLKQEQNLTVTVPMPGNNPPNTNSPGDPPPPRIQGYSALEYVIDEVFGADFRPRPGTRPLTPAQIELLDSITFPVAGGVVPIAGDGSPPMDDVM